MIIGKKPQGLLIPKPKPIYLVKDGKLMMRKVKKVKKPKPYDRP